MGPMNLVVFLPVSVFIPHVFLFVWVIALSILAQGSCTETLLCVMVSFVCVLAMSLTPTTVSSLSTYTTALSHPESWSVTYEISSALLGWANQCPSQRVGRLAIPDLAGCY